MCSKGFTEPTYETKRRKKNLILQTSYNRKIPLPMSSEEFIYSDFVKQKLKEFIFKIRRWTLQLGLSKKVLLHTILLFFGFMLKPTSASFFCDETQTGELGERGGIVCTFPDSFQSVLWYNDVQDGNSPIIKYTFNNRGDRKDFCLENENYDVSENGSLIICNVAVWHEKNYTVIVDKGNGYEEFTVFFKVIASPGNRPITVHFGNKQEGRYHLVNTNGTLSCSFDVARPTVSIEWVQRYPEGDSLIAMQDVSVTNNTNGTYNTSAETPVVAKSDKHMAVLECIATFPSSEWKRESKILLDFSQKETFSSEPSPTLYMETRRRAEIKCEQSDLIIWKSISTTGEPKTIAFRFGNLTEMIEDVNGIEISAEGNLIFPSPRIEHEGEYVCVYSDGFQDKIQKTAVVVMIAPSPPFIKVAGCNDAEFNCVLKGEVIQELTCSVDGVYPNASLEWVARNPSKIFYYNSSTINKKRGQVYDVSSSVKFLLSGDLMCEDKIYIECRLQGPTSRIMRAEREAELTTNNCMLKGDDRDDEWIIWIQRHVLGLLDLFLILILFVVLCIYFVKRRNRRGSISSKSIGIYSDSLPLQCFGVEYGTEPLTVSNNDVERRNTEQDKLYVEDSGPVLTD